MPAFKALLIFGVLIVLVAAGAFFFFPSLRPEFVEDWFRRARGFGPARTPTEAIDRFKDALKQRDYATAATFCTADYAEQLRKGARGAKNLGEELDNILSIVNSKNIKLDDHSKKALDWMEPFPRIKVVKLHHKEGENVASVDWVEDREDAYVPTGDFRIETWNVNLLIMRTLQRGVPYTGLRLKREGEGVKAVWKIEVPVPSVSPLRDAVEYLKVNHENYARALRQVKNEVKNDASTQANIRDRLKSELEQLK